MAEVLELTQLAQQEHVAEVEVGACRVDSQLDSERPVETRRINRIKKYRYLYRIIGSTHAE